MTKKNNLLSIAQSKKTWLIASSVFLSTGVGELTNRHHVVSADEGAISQQKTSGSQQFSPTTEAGEKTASAVSSSDAPVKDDSSAQADKIASTTIEQKREQQKSNHESQQSEVKATEETMKDKKEGGMTTRDKDEQAVIKQLGEAFKKEQTLFPQADLVIDEGTRDQLKKIAEEILNEVAEGVAAQYDENNEKAGQNNPLEPLYKATKTSSYEELVDSLGGFLPNFAHPGDAKLNETKDYVKKPGVLEFGVPEYRFFGMGSKQNDYSNVSSMRLITDKSFVRKVADNLISYIGTPYRGTTASYRPETNTLVYSGGFPFYAVVQSSNGSVLSPSFFFAQFNRMLQTVSNMLTNGWVPNYLNNQYDAGQYGIYLRMEAPEGTNPNDFVKTLSLDKTKFGAQMDFNINLSVDELLNRVPGLEKVISASIGIPISGYAGSAVDYLLAHVLNQVNEKEGTNYSVRGMDSPFYPITLYPNDIKTNVKEDPRGMYFLVCGSELKDFSSRYVQAKILVTKFFMNALSWGGNIVGGAYGYLNFDLDQFPGNLSSHEMKKLLGKGAAQSDAMNGYADNSPYKVLTRGQLPPAPNGRLNMKLNSLDANAMLSKKNKFYSDGDLGRDIAIDKNKMHDNELKTEDVKTWRAYISPFDKLEKLNTKTVASSVTEWPEVKGEDRVLPGADLDHRKITMAVGERFYNMHDRFDRVIDYFTGDVLLDKNGFHPNDEVKGIKLVKSVDPEGQKTSEADFDIYNRPFTVYYTGQMKLRDGSIIALRPTAVSVLQPNEDFVNELNQKRTAAYDAMQKQMLLVRKTITNLRPKVADKSLVDYLHRLDNLLVEANLSLEKQSSSADIEKVALQTMKDAGNIQGEAGLEDAIDQAVLKSVRQLNIKKLVEAAHEQEVLVRDALDLMDDERTDIEKEIKKIKAETKKLIVKAAKHRSARSVDNNDTLAQIERDAARGIEAIENLYLSRDKRDNAVTNLRLACWLKKNDFDKIPNVDLNSLTEQKKAVHTLFADYAQRLQRCRDKSELQQTLNEGLLLLRKIDDPKTAVDQELVTKEDQQQAKQTLKKLADEKKAGFDKIEHVDEKSLLEQKSLVDQLIIRSNEAFDQAHLKKDLKAALEKAITELQTIADPMVALEYQVPTNEARQAAKNQVAEAAKQKKAAMAAIEHVLEKSLSQQTQLLNEVAEQANKAIDDAKNVAELNEVLADALSKIDGIADPEKDPAYQAASPSSRENAVERLNKKAQSKKAGFDELDGAQVDSVIAQKKEVDQRLAKALKEVAKAETAGALDKAFRDGLLAIDGVLDPEVLEGQKAVTDEERAKATQKLEDLAGRRLTEFEHVVHVDENSLADQKRLLNKLLNVSLEDLKKAEKKDDLALALSRGKKLIQEVALPKLSYDYRPATQADKKRVYNKLKEAADAKKQDFDSMKHLDASSLFDQKQLVDYALQLSKEKIDEVELNKDLNQIFQDGLKAIQDVAKPDLALRFREADEAAKDEAIQTIKQAGAAKKASFEAMAHVDESSLNVQKLAVDNQVNIGKEAVERAETNGQLSAALAQALKSIDQVAKPVLSDDYRVADKAYKDAAKKRLEDEKLVVYKAFTQVEHVDTASLEKQDKILETTLQNALGFVDKANTRGQVNTALANGLIALNNVSVPNIQVDYLPVTNENRKAAIAMLQRVADHKKQDFEKIEHVDQESLKKQEGVLEHNLQLGEDQVNLAQFQGELNDAVEHGLELISMVANPSLEKAYQVAEPASKDDAKKQLDKAAEDKKKSFKDIFGVDPDDENKQDKKVDDALDKAKKAVDEAQTNGEVDKAFRDGLAAIDDVPDPSVQEAFKPSTAAEKDAGKKRLDEAAFEKKKNFHAIPHVDQTSEANQDALVDGAVDKAKKAVDAAKTKGEVEKAVKDGLDTIQTIADPTLEPAYQAASQADKNEAIATLYQAVDDKKKAFEGIEHVDQNSLSKQVDELADIEKSTTDQIQAAQTKGGVDQALKEGLAAVNRVLPPVVERDYREATAAEKLHAKKVVSDAAEQKKQAFDHVAFADKNSLTKQKHQVDLIAHDAKENIAKAETKGQLDGLVSKALSDIEKVAEPSLDEKHAPVEDSQRDMYLNRLEEEANRIKKDFAAIPHVDQNSLEEQVSLLDQALVKGKDKIKSAATGGELTEAYLSAQDSLRKVSRPQLQFDYLAPTKQAIEAMQNKLKAVAEQQKQSFERIENVDQGSLKEQETEIDRLTKWYLEDLGRMETNRALTKAYNKAVEDIQNVALPTLKPTRATLADQSAAKQHLRSAGEEKKHHFEMIHHADREQLHQQCERVDELVEEYTNKIDKTVLKADLPKVLAEGTMAISSVQDPALKWDYRLVSEADRNDAKNEITELANVMKHDYASIYGVDQKSLQTQMAAIDTALAHGLKSLDLAVYNKELIPALQNARQELLAIQKPKLERRYQAPNAEDKSQMQNEMRALGESKKDGFKALQGAVAASLNAQCEKVDKAVQNGLNKVNDAQFVWELDSAFDQLVKDLANIAGPEIEEDMRPVTEEAIAAALAELAQTRDQRQKEMEKIPSVDADSLHEQQAKVQKVYENYVPTVKATKTMGELHHVTSLVKALLMSISDPLKEAVSQADRDAAKKKIDDAAKDFEDKVKEIPNPDPADRDEIEKDLHDDVDEAKAAIDRAKTPKELDDAVSDGLDKINNLPLPTPDNPADENGGAGGDTFRDGDDADNNGNDSDGENNNGNDADGKNNDGKDSDGKNNNGNDSDGKNDADAGKDGKDADGKSDKDDNDDQPDKNGGKNGQPGKDGDDSDGHNADKPADGNESNGSSDKDDAAKKHDANGRDKKGGDAINPDAAKPADNAHSDSDASKRDAKAEKDAENAKTASDRDASKDSDLKLKKSANATTVRPVAHALPDTAEKDSGKLKQTLAFVIVGLASAFGYKKTKKNDE